MKRNSFPFTAIIGQERMKTALLLNAVDPGIGGVLISGHKGTGKSTAVRALARILPQIEAVADCPFACPPDDENRMCDACRQQAADGKQLSAIERTMPVVELPLSATEDRVVGTLHVEQALKTGERRFDPGLLAAANRGILYVDEVNLLDDHLVDILLDAAASGINIVEREGISHTHPAGFILLGTMNPEEGELRPQLLDRFGLSLSVKSLDDTRMRQTIVRSRIAFDRSPETFLERWAETERMLTEQILRARKALGDIRIPGRMLELAVRLPEEVKAQGHRADIAIIKTARALAAIVEKPEIEAAHISEAARYVLPHRITNVALATPELLDKKLEEALSKVLKDGHTSIDDTASDDGRLEDWEEISTQVPGSWAASNTDMIFSFFEEKKKRFLKRTNSSASKTST
jgi:Mg-chelatase subunit ChlI